MEKKIEEVKKTAIELVQTHTTKDLLAYLLGNLPKDSYTYKDIVQQERIYKRVCQRREEGNLKENEFLIWMNRIDFSISSIIGNIRPEGEAEESTFDQNEPLSLSKEKFITEKLKNNWIHIVMALVIATIIIVQLSNIFY